MLITFTVRTGYLFPISNVTSLAQVYIYSALDMNVGVEIRSTVLHEILSMSMDTH
jgi:hypothetical protein